MHQLRIGRWRWLLAVLLISVVIVGTGVAVDTDRPREFVTASSDSATPVTVYVGERLNISGVKLNDRSETIGDGSVTLQEVGGAETIIINGESANFETADTGRYSADSNDSAEIRVTDPSISSFRLFQSDDEDDRVGDRVQQDSIVYLNPEWNFDEADALELTITDPDGLDVTDAVIDIDESDSAGGVDASLQAGEVGQSGQDVALDFSGLGSGEYTIAATGTDFGPTESLSVDVTGSDAEITFDPSNVSRGEDGVMTLSGFADQEVILKVPARAVSNKYPAVTDADGDVAVTSATAEILFTGAVEARVGGESLGSNAPADADSHFYIPVIPGSDGRERIGIKTEYFEPDQTVEVQLLRPTVDGTIEARLNSAVDTDSAELQVDPARITLTESPPKVPIGGEFNLRGNVTGVNELSLYVRDAGTWYPVEFESGRLSKPIENESSPVENESFDFTARASGRLNITGGYLLGITSTDEIQRQGLTPTTTLSTRTFAQLDPAATASIISVKPEMKIQLERSRLAVGSAASDSIRLTGQVEGVGEETRVHIISPRGELRSPPTGTQTRVRNASIEFEFGQQLETEGKYLVLVVAPGRDGEFTPTDNQLDSIATAGAQTQTQVLERLVDAYQPVGGDDRVRTTSFLAQPPRITIQQIDADGRVPPEVVQIQGETNRGPEQEVYITLQDNNQAPVRTTIGVVNDSADRWHAELNLVGVQPGEYTLNVVGPAAKTSTQIEVIKPATPAEQFPTAVPAEAATGERAQNQNQNQNQSQNAATVAPTDTPEPQLLDLNFQTALQFTVALLATVVLISGVVLIRTRE